MTEQLGGQIISRSDNTGPKMYDFEHDVDP